MAILGTLRRSERSERRPLASALISVDLLIVAVIAGIMSASAVPLYLANARQGRAVEAIIGLGAVRQAQSAYRVQHGCYLAVTEGCIGDEPLDSTSPGLSLDFGSNTYFGARCFSVRLDESFGYTAKCDGGAAGNAVPRARDVSRTIVEMRCRGGSTRYSFDGGVTYSEWR